MTAQVRLVSDTPPDNDISVLHQAMRELGIKVEYKLTKEARKKLSAHLYSKYGWQQGRIAKALNVSQWTISQDLGGLEETYKPPRPKGGRPKGSKGPRSQPRKPHYKEPEIVGLIDKGLTCAEIADQTGIGPRAVRDIIEREHARREAQTKILNALHVDPETLSVSAQAKLKIAQRQIESVLRKQYEDRARKLDDEVRQRVLDEGKEYLAKLDEMQEKASLNEQFYREMMNNHKPIFTIDQFNLIRKCLHQGGVAATAKDFDAAFDLIQKRKLQLTGNR